MRDYAIASPRFWTGDTGKLLKQLGRDYQVVGFYLFTCASSNMIGLYYIGLPTLCHEVGNLTVEGALKVLGRLSEANYAHYDEASEYVWLPNMAREQIGETMVRHDKRRKGVIKLLEQARKTPFFQRFVDKYGEAYHLLDDELLMGLGRGLEAPQKVSAPPFGDQDQDQDQEHDQEQEQECARATAEVGNKLIPSHAALVCKALKDTGILDVNSAHPKLIAMVDEGAELEEFVEAGKEAIAKQIAKPFPYLLAVVEGRRREAARMGATGLSGALPATGRPTATEELLANLTPRVIEHAT